MNKIILLILISLFLNAKESEKISLGFLYNNIYVSEKDATLGFKLWKEHLRKTKQDKVEIFFYKDISKILDDYTKNKKIDILLISPLVFFNNRDKLFNISKKFWTFQMGKYRLFEYYILKHKKSKFSLNDLENKSVVYKAGDGTAKFWIDKISFEKFKKPVKKVAIIKKPKTSQSKVVYDVFFQKSDFAVVPKEAYDTLVDLNPQIKSHLVILKKSPPIFSPVMGMFHKRLNDKMMGELTDFIDNMNNTIEGTLIFSAASLNKIVYITNEEFMFFDKFFDDYIAMKKKYKEGK